jgi:hypothetical protein
MTVFSIVDNAIGGFLTVALSREMPSGATAKTTDELADPLGAPTTAYPVSEIDTLLPNEPE